MAGERTLPGLGLTAFYTPGTHGWDLTLDPDLRLLSTLCQMSVLSRTTVLPGSPANGDIYIIKVGEPNEREIAIRDNGAWVRFVPGEGFLGWVKDDNEYVTYNGTAWTALSTGASTFVGLTDTPGTLTGQGGKTVKVNVGGTALEFVTVSGGATSIRTFAGTTDTAVLADAENIIQSTGAAAATATIPANASVAYAVGATLTYIQTGTGQVTIAGAGGVTVNQPSALTKKLTGQYSVVSLIKTATDTWVLTGDLEAV